MFDIHEIIENINDKMHRKVADMDSVSGRQLGLDPRCGRAYVNKDCIITEQPRLLDYYGGFEYVDKDYRIQLGDYTIFLADDDRVKEAIATFYENEAEVN